jgi:hypothetical protein
VPTRTRIYACQCQWVLQTVKPLKPVRVTAHGPVTGRHGGPDSITNSTAVMVVSLGLQLISPPPAVSPCTPRPVRAPVPGCRSRWGPQSQPGGRADGPVRGQDQPSQRRRRPRLRPWARGPRADMHAAAYAPAAAVTAAAVPPAAGLAAAVPQASAPLRRCAAGSRAAGRVAEARSAVGTGSQQHRDWQPGRWPPCCLIKLSALVNFWLRTGTEWIEGGTERGSEGEGSEAASARGRERGSEGAREQGSKVSEG